MVRSAAYACAAPILNSQVLGLTLTVIVYHLGPVSLILTMAGPWPSSTGRRLKLYRLSARLVLDAPHDLRLMLV